MLKVHFSLWMDLTHFGNGFMLTTLMYCIVTKPPVLVAEERKIIMAMPLFVFENNTQSFHQRSSYQIIKLQDAWWAAFEETWLINIMFALAHSSFF